MHACSDAYCNLRRIEWVGYLDADLATPLSEFKELVRIGANDQTLHAVLGSRLPLSGRRIERDWKRRIASRIFALATFTLFRLNIKDTQCGAKLFRRGPWLSSVCQQPFGDRWLFDVELLVRMRRVFGQEFGNKVFEQPLRQWHDENGSRLKLTDFAMAPYHLIKMAWRQSFLQSTPKQAGLPYSEPEAVAERVQQNEQWREERKAA